MRIIIHRQATYYTYVKVYNTDKNEIEEIKGVRYKSEGIKRLDEMGPVGWLLIDNAIESLTENYPDLFATSAQAEGGVLVPVKIDRLALLDCNIYGGEWACVPRSTGYVKESMFYGEFYYTPELFYDRETMQLVKPDQIVKEDDEKYNRYYVANTDAEIREYNDKLSRVVDAFKQMDRMLLSVADKLESPELQPLIRQAMQQRRIDQDTLTKLTRIAEANGDFELGEALRKAFRHHYGEMPF